MAGRRQGKGMAKQAVGMMPIKILMAYCLVSIATLPFLNWLWLGELPVLAVVQAPKLGPATIARKQIVMPLIGMLGLSKGSFSPDYIMARPYGLLLVYLVPAGIIIGYAIGSVEARRTKRGMLILAMVILCADYVCTMIFGAGPPGITIY
jgi:hypothetical protein